MPESPPIEAAINRGLAFLEKRQQSDGSFLSHSSASIQPFRRLRSWQTTFVPALILTSLAGLEGSAARRIRARLAGFLLKQKDTTWAFNYWARTAPEYQAMPYPNDLDDTFCALAGLYLHDSSLVGETVLAQVIKLLLATETAVGGPYRTWLVSPASEAVWLDVDVAVNSNIAYFLSLVSNRLPKLDALMSRAIVSDTFSSPYYPSVYAFVYYFARAYGGPHKDRLLRKARQLHKAASTDLDQALCLSARVRLGETQDLSSAAKVLLAAQQADGSWPAAVFYADPVKNGKRYYNGGAALTTAFVLEALQLYAADAQNHTMAAPDYQVADQYQLTSATILTLAKKQCATLPTDLRRTMVRSLTTLADSSNGKEIIGLAGDCNRSLHDPLEPPDDFLENLSLANLYGWLAYTIYDDFLDEEGQSGLLPAANVAMRYAVQGFLKVLPADRSFHALVYEVFDIIDAANTWELAHCRYRIENDNIVLGTLPNYQDLAKLAERSLGHTLGPIAILAARRSSAAARKHTRQALNHYLIVRQLNDDLHDWQEDLTNGHITYVVTHILSGLRIKRGRHNLSNLVAEARPQFWYKTLPIICREMQQHLTAGRQSLQRAGIFEGTNGISKLLDGLEVSVQDILAQQGQAENFLKQYRRKAAKL
jgi:hypothetical protein